MNKFITGVIGLVAITALIISLAKVGGNSQPAADLGASGTRFPNGISANNVSPAVGQIIGTTLTTGSLTVTTSNTATSTSYLGCINTTATSTATRIRMVFTDTATNTKAGPNGTSANGSVLWQYGTCP